MNNEIGLDKILKHVGEFGCHQIITFSSIFFVAIFTCACHMAYVFTAMETENRCFIPGCDEEGTKFDADYVDFAIPHESSGKPKKCEMYFFRNNTQSNLTCLAEQFETDKIRFCGSFVFKQTGNSIAKEYDLLCEKDAWKLSLVGSVNTFGMLLGIWITGYLSDSYGRKSVIIFGMSLGGLIGFSKTFAPNFQLFCSLEFLEAFIESGAHCSIFILAIELVIPEHRFWTSCVFFSVCSSGQMVLAAVAWMVKDWRLIIYILYGPSIFFFLLYPFIMESMRWQLSKGDIDRAKKNLNEIAKSNGKSIPPSYFYTLHRSLIENKEKCQRISLMQMMKSRILLLRFIVSTFLWITCALLFYGLSLSSMSLAGNDYLNFLLVSFIEIPAYCLMPLVTGRIRRKSLLLGSYFLTSISCVFLIFCSDEGSDWFHLILHSMGKFGATIAFNILYIMTSEMFPTPLRHTTMGLCSMIGRIGSMISPQISLMGMLWLPLPNVIFASTASMAGMLSFLLPETIGVRLPDTIEEAEIVGKSSAEENEEEDCENNAC